MSDDKKRLGEVGFNAYGNAGPTPWKTFDGREMPRYESLHGDVGDLTKMRWEAAAMAVMGEVREYLLRGENPPGYRWDAFANRYVHDGASKGPAVAWNRTHGA